MHKKFEINQTKIKGGCQSGRKVVVAHDSKSDLPLVIDWDGQFSYYKVKAYKPKPKNISTALDDIFVYFAGNIITRMFEALNKAEILRPTKQRPLPGLSAIVVREMAG